MSLCPFGGVDAGMEFGKVDSLDGVEWALPPDPPLTEHVLGQLPDRDEARVYVGSTAWGQRGFVGTVYPRGTKPGGQLAACGRQFNAIELNASFYRVPDRAQVLKWYAAVPDDFRFCPKVNKAISQASDLGIATSRTLDFAKAIQHFEHKLGPCFIQLPGDFTTERWAALEAWLADWPPHLRLAVELRHESWFSTSTGADAFAAFAARGIGSVITDVAGRRDAAHMQITAPFAVVRWVGNVDETDHARLLAWAQRCVRWTREGLGEVYVFTHQPEELPSARSAAEFARAIRAAAPEGFQIQTRAPRFEGVPSDSPAQGQLF